MFLGDALLSGERKYFGYIQDRPELTLADLSEEHAHLLVPDNIPLRVGDRLSVIPNHICPRINLQDHVFLISGDQVIDQWNVTARGMVT